MKLNVGLLFAKHEIVISVLGEVRRFEGHGGLRMMQWVIWAIVPKVLSPQERVAI